MSLSDLVIESEYRSLAKNIVKDFFIPVLKESFQYDRAVGFFSSSALIEISKGLSGLIKNNGKIRLICSPKLTEEDIEAISAGYKERNEIIANALLRNFYLPKTSQEEDRLSLLAELISKGNLDIKVAFIKKANSIAIYHEKMGIFHDCQDNVVCFSGSLNESKTAFYENYEAIDIFCSWKSDFENRKIRDKIIAFENLWNNNDFGVEIIKFPDICKEKLLKFKKEKVNTSIDDDEFFQPAVFSTLSNIFGDECPNLGKEIELYDYQEKAISNWLEQGSVGIFDMATGTGKTFTALGAICKLFASLKDKKLAVIIVCPFIHLVNQWVEELKLFNINSPIIAYSGSPDKKYKERLKSSVQDFNLGAKSFFCLVTTNSSYVTDKFQQVLSELKDNTLLVVDEAHNFGSEKLKSTLTNTYKFRLALSATIERHNDPDGTKHLFDFFGKKCINYTLEQAIKEKKLTPYYYHPIILTLTNKELDAYNEISLEIANEIAKSGGIDKNGSKSLSERAKLLLIKRSRIVAGAAQKIPKLIEAIKNHKDESHILIYCGAANIIDDFYLSDRDEEIESDHRQIDVVIEELYNLYEMKLARFTSYESIEQRKLILSPFADGSNIQALVAIKCLDEGFNIPQIKTAFILASTTNPKEFIQRRGRVLRLAPNKDYAVIYDFVVLPRPIEEVPSQTQETIRFDLALIENNIERIEEFKNLSLNPKVGDEIISKIRMAYPKVKLETNDGKGN